MAAKQPAGELLMGIGVGREGPVWVDLAKAYNLLFGGAIGGGKSTIINQGLLRMAEVYSPERLRYLLFDLKGGDGVEFGMFNPLPHLDRPVVSDLADCEEVFESVMAELAERFRQLSRLGVKKIEQYNARPREEKQGLGLPLWMPRKVLAIDEFARIWAIPKPGLQKVMAAMETITATGRAAGIHVILATQRPEVDVIPGLIQNNIFGRGAFKVGDPQTSEMLLGKGDYRAQALPPEDPGLMIWKYQGSVRVRAILLKEGEAEDRIRRLSRRPSLLQVEEEEVGRVSGAPEVDAVAPLVRSNAGAPETHPTREWWHDIHHRVTGVKLPMASRLSDHW